MAEDYSDARIRITGNSPAGYKTQVFLNDIEITHLLTDVGVDVSVQAVNKVRLTLLVGHIDLDVPIGTLQLNAKGIAINKAQWLGRRLNRMKNAIGKRFLWLRLSTKVDVAETTTCGSRNRTYIPRD
jgi:hypothetical protein